MSQENYLDQLKQWFIRCKNKLYLFYNNYIRLPCIKFYNYIFIKKIITPIKENANDLDKKDINDIELNNLSLSNVDNIVHNNEHSITKRISYSDSNSNDFQEVSIHRPSISSFISPNYLDQN
jgi:hypothetical protein